MPACRETSMTYYRYPLLNVADIETIIYYNTIQTTKQPLYYWNSN